MKTNTHKIASCQWAGFSYRQLNVGRGLPRQIIWRGKPRPTLVASHGFTLIELMISIALALLLILGVNQIFQYTTQAVGAGEAINAGIRASRAAQATFAADFSSMVANGGNANDAPSIYMASYAAYAFRNAKDQAAEGTASSSTYPPPAYQDLAGSGNFGDTNVNGDTVYPATYNSRNHRLDMLSFFARGLFFRQTGNDGTFVASQASQEAYIWYGHAKLPDNSGSNYFSPSSVDPVANTTSTSATNPNNIFGSQFVLARVAMLLQPANSGVINDSQSNSQNYIDYAAGGWSSIAVNSKCTVDGYLIQQSRYDLANGSISQFRSNLQSIISSQPNWYPPLNYRFLVNPYVAKPMNSAAMAQASPYFLAGCSQFIVEFAGDFLTQDNDPSHTTRVSHTQYGDITAEASDTQIDFTVVNGVKEIKWYGMPRNTSGLNGLNAANGDVLPVRDWLSHGTDPTTFIYPTAINGNPVWNFEKTFPSSSVLPDYSGSNMPYPNNGYICAFAPNTPAPKLIRITMTLEDSTGRLPDGQTYQYVFAVPQQ